MQLPYHRDREEANRDLRALVAEEGDSRMARWLVIKEENLCMEENKDGRRLPYGGRVVGSQVSGEDKAQGTGERGC